MIWFILVLIFISTLYLQFRRSSTYWMNRNVISEQPLPIFGNFIKAAFRKEALGYTLKRMYDKFDDNIPYFGVYVFNTPHLVMKSKEMINLVLIKNFSSFVNRNNYANEKVDAVSSNILFILKNYAWRITRTKISPMFTSSKIKLMLPLMKHITNNLEELLEELNGQQIDINDLFKRYSVDIVSACVFGINAGGLKDVDSKINLMVTRILDQRGFKGSLALFAWMFCPMLVDIFRLPLFEQESSEFLLDVFKQSMEARKKSNIKRHDLIDMLKELKEQETNNDQIKIDDVFMSAQALTFFNGGVETTTSLLSLCIYEMALNPDIQDKLRKEIRENVDSNGSLSYEKLFQLEYLDLVIKESQRKYPIVPFLRRFADNDVIIEETGLLVQKGTPVFIPLLALHYDPKYFPNPNKFDPERFRDFKLKDMQYTYLPFGEGPRKCIGERLALVAAKLGVAMFVKNFAVTPAEKTVVPMKFSKAAFFRTPENGVIFLKVHRVG